MICKKKYTILKINQENVSNKDRLFQQNMRTLQGNLKILDKRMLICNFKINKKLKKEKDKNKSLKKENR